MKTNSLSVFARFFLALLIVIVATFGTGCTTTACRPQTAIPMVGSVPYGGYNIQARKDLHFNVGPFVSFRSSIPDDRVEVISHVNSLVGVGMQLFLKPYSPVSISLGKYDGYAHRSTILVLHKYEIVPPNYQPEPWEEVFEVLLEGQPLRLKVVAVASKKFARSDNGNHKSYDWDVREKDFVTKRR